jgi:hypothetical protein
MLLLCSFSFSEKKRNGVNAGQTYHSKDNPAYDIIGSAEYARDQVVPEKSDETPVDCADDHQNKN